MTRLIFQTPSRSCPLRKWNGQEARIELLIEQRCDRCNTLASCKLTGYECPHLDEKGEET